MIIQTQGPEPEPEAFGKACAIAARWAGHNATVYVNPRTAEGWLEYHVDIADANNKRAIMIALIQRHEGAPYESHS